MNLILGNSALANRTKFMIINVQNCTKIQKFDQILHFCNTNLEILKLEVEKLQKKLKL